MTSVQLQRSRLVRWQDGDAWRQGWVMVGEIEHTSSCCGFRLGTLERISGILLVHDPLTRNLYLVPAEAVEDVPMRSEYEQE